MDHKRKKQPEAATYLCNLDDLRRLHRMRRPAADPVWRPGLVETDVNGAASDVVLVHHC